MHRPTPRLRGRVAQICREKSHRMSEAQRAEFLGGRRGLPDKSSNAANPKGRVVGCPGGFREALTHFTCPLALRPVRNQGVVSKACRDLSRNHNAGCGPAWTPRRASAQACVCGVALLANRTTIGCTPRLASAHLSTRRGHVKWVSASLWGAGQAAPFGSPGRRKAGYQTAPKWPA
jgi:hypothetical protein